MSEATQDLMQGALQRGIRRYPDMRITLELDDGVKAVTGGSADA